MRNFLLVSAVLVATAVGCGSSDAVSVSTAGDQTANTSAAQAGGTESSVPTVTADSTDSEATIPVKNLSDMPDACIKLFGEFLKQIEPIVSPIDWNKATVAQFGELGDQFAAESDALDAKSKAAGCDKYDLQTTDPTTIKQLVALAATVAPGTVAFINFLGTLTATTQTTLASAGGCDDVIAQIEPYLNTGKTIKDLTIAEVNKFYGLISQVATACPQDKATEFYGRADVQAFTNA